MCVASTLSGSRQKQQQERSRAKARRCGIAIVDSRFFRLSLCSRFFSLIAEALSRCQSIVSFASLLAIIFVSSVFVLVQRRQRNFARGALQWVVHVGCYATKTNKHVLIQIVVLFTRVYASPGYESPSTNSGRG